MLNDSISAKRFPENACKNWIHFLMQRLLKNSDHVHMKMFNERVLMIKINSLKGRPEDF